MTYRTHGRIGAGPAASPAAIALILGVMLGPIVVFAVAMRLFAG